MASLRSHYIFCLAATCLILQLQRSEGQWGLARALQVIGEVGGLVDKVDGGEIKIEHPATGNKCLDISGAHPYPGGKVILYNCKKFLWATPVNQRFQVMEGSTHDSHRFSPPFSHVKQVCIYTGNNYNDPLFTIHCDDGDRARLSFRRIKVAGRDPRFLIQQVATNRCLRPDGDYIRAVQCNTHDEQQHFVQTGA